MTILLPTHDESAPLASISLALLHRYWPDHPQVHVLHGAAVPKVQGDRVRLHRLGSNHHFPWLGPVRSFLREQDEELFLLMLDDYALCGPARTDVLDRAARMMREFPLLGLFPLSWYPAARREPRAGTTEIETLFGAPILLQTAIWRRSWFLQLAEGLDERTSPWGFEALATRRARLCPMEICAGQMPTPAYVGGHLIDGFDKSDWPLPYHNLMHRGQPELKHEAFLRAEGFAFPSRGLGDTAAKIAEASGIAQVANLIKQATGSDCGCQRRRAALNRMVPYR